jgi:hypothetical protein
MNDTILRRNALKCLIDNFGIVQAERFISLIIKEPFDYTKWQSDLYGEMTVNELFDAASSWKASTTSD